jgi:transcriptional regulator with XRE-family HTH domain
VNTSLVKRDLLNSLKDREFREAFKLENVYTGICFQIRALREQRTKSQKELGKLARMAQERISILEDPNAETKPTLTTLLRLADALDVGLDVRFVPFSTVLDRSVNTDMKELEVQSFDKELPALELAIEAELADKKDAVSVRAQVDQWEMLRGKRREEIKEEANPSRGWIEIKNRDNTFERTA